MDELISKLSSAFNNELPGWDAHRKMINYDRPSPGDIDKIDPEARPSAVLALLYLKNEKVHTVLIERNVYEGTHSGQIGFPGGKPESVDNNLWQTALREANEELSIIPEKVQLIGELTKVYIPPSRFLVSPYLAYTKEIPNFIPDQKEVQQALEIPIEQFFDQTRLKEKYLYLDALNTRMKIKYYDIQDKVIWGATAMMLSEISELLNHTGEFKI